MSTLDSDLGFEAVLRESALAGSKRVSDRTDRSYTGATAPTGRKGIAALTIFAVLGIISAAIFAIGYSALLSDTPAIWIHRLMALTVAQSILIAGVTMKLLPIIERNGFSVRVDSRAGFRRLAMLDPPVRAEAPTETVPPPLPRPRKPVIGGQLAGREYLAHDDGSIEIDTLVGRRRFVSLDAAKEFVGS
jgi:hypothetical protein